MKCEFISVADHGVEATGEVLTRAFADYFVKIPTTGAVLLQMARCDSVDLAQSRVMLRGGVAVGAGLIARRGWTSRLAGMALIPEARRQGLGQVLVERLLEEARNRGDRGMVLEVIEQNEPAVKLYERCGFQRVRRLVGFSAPPAEQPSTVVLAQVDLREMAAAVTAHAGPDFPWQLSGETLAHLTPPAVAYRNDGCWVAVSHLEGSPVAAVRGLVVDRSVAAASAEAAAVLRAVRARHPGREWRIGAVWPEELGDMFLQAGFVRTPMTQWQMRRDVAAEGEPAAGAASVG